MVKIGIPLTKVAKKALLCGSGELGKEVALELQRYGVEVIALDRYENAPAMQVAHRSYVLSMLDGAKLREIIEKEKPDMIIPEVEAIATPTLVELEKEGYNVIPTANATFLTMNRKGIRQLAHETLGLVPGVTYTLRETNPRGVRCCNQGSGHSVRGEAHHEFFRSWPERMQEPGRCRQVLEHCPGRRSCRCRRGHCGRLCEV